MTARTTRAMELGELRQVIALAEAAHLRSLEIGGPGYGLRLLLAAPEPAGALAATPAAASAHAEGLTVAAHVTGVFLAAHPMRPAPFVQPGDDVKAGDILGLLRIGRIYAPVTAPQDGIVAGCLVTNGTLVDFGRVLLKIRPHLP